MSDRICAPSTRGSNALHAALFLVGCGSAQPEAQPAPSSTTSVRPAATAAAVTAPSVSAPTQPSGLLTLREARAYMLRLVNRDRASEGVPPVTLDEGSAQAAGQAHAEDMAALGYLGHWGSDGSVPEERLTRAGGADADFENAFCVVDEKARGIDPAARFSATDIERAEDMFFHEVPPNDGHRKTILNRRHNRVGIGLAMPRPGPNEIVVPCISQEFLDAYGTFDPIPATAKVGSTVHVSGTLSAAVKVGGVGIGHIDLPHPLPASELNKRRFYPIPPPNEMYWPHGFKTTIEVKTSGQSFSIDVPITQKGLNEISVWAQFPGEKDFSSVSLRTLRVD